MRIATETIFRQGLSGVQQAQSDLVRTQNQLSTGNRISRAGEDPAAFSSAQRMDARLSALEGFERSSARADHRLRLADNRLAEAGDIMNRVRELLLQGSNGSTSAVDRDGIAVELEGLKARLLEVANSEDGEGNPLFAGTAGGPAFAESAGNIVYNGTDAVRLVEINTGQTVADTEVGSRVFGREPDTAFAAIDAAIATLAEPDPALRSAAAAAGIDRIDAGLEDATQGRVRIGSRLVALEQAVEVRASESLHLAEARSGLMDTDLAAAITDLSLTETRLGAAQQSYLRVQQLSLFDLLR